MHDNALGAYLRDRRTRLDPAAFGIAGGRRRTPGLRREEVAQRANISVTWYTWLERGRGGPPSAEVLSRVAHALMLTDAERAHLFLLGLGRPPTMRFPQEAQGISPIIQRLLDALVYSPAYVKTLTWDLVAWNRPAAAMFEYDDWVTSQRNILRRLFCGPVDKGRAADWNTMARFVVSAFRADAARAAAAGNAAAELDALVNDLCDASPEFSALWQTHEINPSAGGIKRLQYAQGVSLTFEVSTLAIDGRPDLNMVVFNPATPADIDLVRSVIGNRFSREELAL